MNRRSMLGVELKKVLPCGKNHNIHFAAPSSYSAFDDDRQTAGNAMENNKLLLVDDDPFILEGIGSDLEIHGYRVTRASSGEMAVDLLEKTHFNLIITDLIMEATDGIQVLKRAKELNPEVQVIILTGYGDLNSAIKAMRSNADDYLLKPCESLEMIFRVKNCLEKQEMIRKINLYQKILPMCRICKKIRVDCGKQPGSGEWVDIETFIGKSAEVDITSEYCPQCARQAPAGTTPDKFDS